MNTVERPYPYIAVAGPSGAVKTVVAEKMAEGLGYTFIQEQHTPNPHPKEAVFQALTHIFTKKIQQIEGTEKQHASGGVVVDTPLQQIVFAYGRARLHGYNWGLFQSLYESLQPFLMTPSLVVCLEADAQVINLPRLLHNRRDIEMKHSPQDLTEFNHEWIFALQIPVIHINMRSFNGKRFDYQHIVDQIHAKLNAPHD